MPTISKNDFVAGLKKSKVIDEERLDEWLSKCNREDPKDIAVGLVKEKLLTKWQAKFLLSGRTKLDLGSYRLLERIQRDELGDRFLAMHTSLGRKVDIQVLPSELTKDTERFNAFIKKSTNAARLDHPNLIHVYDIDKDGGLYFLATEHFEGITLDQKPKSELNEAFIAKLTQEIVGGLGYAHKNDVVHGSICPADLVFTNDGDFKLDHVALAPLRNGQGTLNPEKDYVAISRIGLALIKNLPAGSESANIDALKLALKSIQTGKPDVIEEALATINKMDFEEEIEEAIPLDDFDPLSGGFDSPMPTTQIRKPKPKKVEEPGEVEAPKSLGMLGTLWATNPVAVIATSVVLGLMVVGGSIFGINAMLSEKPIAKNNGSQNTTQVSNKPKDVEPKANKDDDKPKADVGKPDFSDPKAMEEQIAKLVGDGDNNNNKQGGGNKNPMPPKQAGKQKNTPDGNQSASKTPKQFTSPVTKEVVKIGGSEIPANTPVDVKFMSEEGWAEVEVKIGNQNKVGWIKVGEIAESTTPPGQAGITSPVSTNNANMAAAGNNNANIASPPAGTGNDPETKPPVPEPLDRIRGIGPATQQALYEKGITTFKQLGDLNPEQVRVALGNVVARRTNDEFQRWINEARGIAGMGAAPTTPATSSSTTAAAPAATTPKPNTDTPFAKFPRITGLPAVNDTKEIKIAQLTIKKTHLLATEILCEEGFSRSKLIFELTRGDKAGDGSSKVEKQKWYVGVKRRESEKPTNIGLFRKSEDGFHFKWLPEAEKNKYAEYLRNCILRLKLPDETQTYLTLRRPMKVADLRINPEALSNKLEFAIPAMPHFDTISVELLPMRVKGTEINVIQPTIAKGLPGVMYLKRHDKTGFLRFQVAGEVKSKVRLQSNLILLAQGQAQPVSDLSMLDAVGGQLNQQRVFFQNQLQKAKTDAEKKPIQSNIGKAQSSLNLLQEYREILGKMWNQPVAVRIYAKLGNFQVMLVETDPKLPQPKKKR